MPMTSIRLKNTVLESLKEDNKIKAMLCGSLNKSYPTIARWIRENSAYLTMAGALQIISEELNIPVDQLTERVN